MINGCVAKNGLERKSEKKVVISSAKLEKTKPSSIKKASIKKEDCVDCYAAPMDYSKPPSLSNNTFAKTIKNPTQTKYKRGAKMAMQHFGSYGYKETASDVSVKSSNYLNSKVAAVPSTVNSSYGKYSAKMNTSIQVGAFSQYNGAKVYMKRYSALSSKYQVTIKTGTKNNKPLHRVRIEGFKNKSEAKKFMYSYGIRDAFVVRK